jgi:alkylation response protein AidB-like acyl-CoA dehydrogenase
MASDLSSSTAAEALRERARPWLAANTPPDWRNRLAGLSEDEAVDFYRQWARELHSQGLLVPHWPERFGGLGLGVRGQLVVQEELSRADAPRPRPLTISLGHAAATLMEHGDAEQQRLVEGILDGTIWCQGFSEPDAGSDLANLRTRAARRGDHYVVNGQKIWSSFAAHAEWCLLLVRTDPAAERHRGISFLMMKMDSPGVTVRPIRQSTGHAEFCEIFLDDVEIPVANRIGDEGDGWRVAMTTLSTERVIPIFEHVEGIREAISQMLDQIEALPERPPRHAALISELTEAAMEAKVLGLSATETIRVYLETGELGPSTSVLKLLHSELNQKVTRIGAEIGGLDALIKPGDDLRDLGYLSGDWFIDHMRSWTFTIAAGSSEIQRNVIAERVLGLPKEAR